MGNAMVDSWDTDNDGSVIDNSYAWGTNFVGNAMAATGALSMGAGGLLAAMGGAETMTVFGAPLGMTKAAAGAGLGMFGAALTAGGLMLGSDAAVASMEEVGDFTADLFGTRQAPPYPTEEIGDLHYKTGRTDGLGQQINRGITGAVEQAGDWLFPPTEPVMPPITIP
jgi:hypothetical protein